MSGPVFERAKWYEDEQPRPAQQAQRTVLIEHTGKELKAVMLIGGLVFVGGMAAAAWLQSGIGLLAAGVGAWSWLVARIVAWWNHG